MSLSIIFQLYRGSQFYWRRKQECTEKTTELSKSLKLPVYHLMLYHLSRIQTHNIIGDMY